MHRKVSTNNQQSNPEREGASNRFDVTDTAVPTSTPTVPQNSYDFSGCLKFFENEAAGRLRMSGRGGQANKPQMILRAPRAPRALWEQIGEMESAQRFGRPQIQGLITYPEEGDANGGQVARAEEISRQAASVW